MKRRLAGRIGAHVPPRFRGSDGVELAGRRVQFACGGAIGGGLLASFPGALVAAPLLGAFGWRLAGFAEARRERERSEAVRNALPDVLDLLAVCALGGMGLDPALRMVAPATPGPLGAALSSMLRALDAGIPRADAYLVLEQAARTEEVAGLVAAMRRAERYGSPLAETIAAQAAHLRAQRHSRVRERALGTPVRMLFPLTLCFLPAFVLLAIAPALLTAVRTFRGL